MFFARDKFIYDKDTDSFMCPNNEKLNRLPKAQLKNDKKNNSYSASSISCNNCSLRDKCIPTKTKCKRLYRWEYEEIVDIHKVKMKTQKAKDIVKRRGSIVEHPFGTIKRVFRMGSFFS